MLKNDEKLGAFIIPTGIGASIGGYAGDASCWARKFSQLAKLIVNPNVVNAGGFSGINENMLYVEGFALNDFFKNKINLLPAQNNKIGVVFDKAIPQDVLNIHINTIRATKCVYGVEVIDFNITDEIVGVEFNLQKNGTSAGSVKNIETIIESAKKLIAQDSEAIAVVCFFEDPEEDNEDYANGIGTDPVGGVEAIISHSISKALNIPCAHSPAFADCQINSQLVDEKSASEYITPTFLPCVLLGLQNAPKFTNNNGLNIKDLDFLIMPIDSLGSVPIFEAIKNNIKIYAIDENKTALNVTAQSLNIADKITVCESYQECFDLINC